MTKSFAWTTPRGAKVEMMVNVKHVTSEVISADGFPVECACDRWEREIVSCKVNGRGTALRILGIVCGKESVIIDRRGSQDIAAALPQNVIDAIYGEERTAKMAKLDAEIAVEKKYEEHRAMMRKAMGY